MIAVNDPTLRAALNKLRTIPELSGRIFDLEKAGYCIKIEPAPTQRSSKSEQMGSLIFEVRINSEMDDDIAQCKWGISGTKEENSIAHELGHIYFNYLTEVQQKKIPPAPQITRMNSGKPTWTSPWPSGLTLTRARKA